MNKYDSRAARRRSGAHGTKAKVYPNKPCQRAKSTQRRRYYQTWRTVASPVKRTKNRLPCNECTITSLGWRDATLTRNAPKLRFVCLYTLFKEQKTKEPKRRKKQDTNPLLSNLGHGSLTGSPRRGSRPSSAKERNEVLVQIALEGLDPLREENQEQVTLP